MWCCEYFREGRPCYVATEFYLLYVMLSPFMRRQSQVNEACRNSTKTVFLLRTGLPLLSSNNPNTCALLVSSMVVKVVVGLSRGVFWTRLVIRNMSGTRGVVGVRVSLVLLSINIKCHAAVKRWSPPYATHTIRSCCYASTYRYLTHWSIGGSGCLV